MSGRTDKAADNAAVLYFGEVMHARLKPMGHRFSYRVMSLLIDLDRLDDANSLSPLFAVNRPALYCFREADHGKRDGSSLRDHVQRCAAERGIDLTGGRVLLLCYPRLLGFTFNPLSVYFCYRADGELGRGACGAWCPSGEACPSTRGARLTRGACQARGARKTSSRSSSTSSAGRLARIMWLVSISR